MLVHFRLNVPTDLVDDVRDLLTGDPRMTNVTHFPGASLTPKGDVFEADVAREATSGVLDSLSDLGLAGEGGIVLSQPAGTPFRAADDVEHAAHGDPDDAVIWLLVHRQAEVSSRPTATYMVFLMIATALASIAVITDSAVLVVGAMVVGPEFAVVAALSTGLALREWSLARRCAWTLLWTFVAAIIAIMILAWIAAMIGLITPADVTRARPQTEFIWRPDVWSVIVALLAGTAGVLGMATDNTSAMVGVFISVTTVPAAGNLALGLAVGSWPEIAGSATQLLVNFGGMIVAGVVTLGTERLIWRRLGDDRRHRIQQRRYARTHPERYAGPHLVGSSAVRPGH